MQVIVVIGLLAGTVDEVEAFFSEDSALRYEAQLCESLGVPLGPQEREAYRDGGGENDVQVFHCTVEV